MISNASAGEVTVATPSVIPPAGTIGRAFAAGF
jgi:hypothetical protein